MFEAPKEWTFSAEILKEKGFLMGSLLSFDGLLEKLCSGIKKIHSYTQIGDKGNVKDCPRFELKLSVAPDVYELFFNSCYGYRAAHFLSPSLGLAVNDKIIRELRKRYIDSHLIEAGETQDSINRKLVPEYSKIWICESENAANDIINSSEFIPDLSIERWKNEAQKSHGKKINCLSLTRAEKNPLRGCRYYTGECLHIKGPFIKDNGDIIVPAIKGNRAEQIHLYGFT